MPLKQGTESLTLARLNIWAVPDKKDAPKAGDGKVQLRHRCHQQKLQYKKDAPKAGDGKLT